MRVTKWESDVDSLVGSVDDGFDSPPSTVSASYHYAYIFQRFPSFTQTFCAREVAEMRRQGVRLEVFSLRDTRDEATQHFSKELVDGVNFLPPKSELSDLVKQWKSDGRLSKEAVLTLRHWGDRSDKRRVYEAIYIGEKLREQGIRHAHCHFAGLAARTCWWIRHLYGITFSITGHANDLFCPEPGSVTLDQLMDDASCLVTVSEFTAKYLRETYPKSAGKVRRVYNGLDLAPIIACGESLKSESKSDPPLIISVGRLIEKKGFADLIKACGVLNRQGVRFQCEIAGDGPLEDELIQLIAAEGVSDLVTLVGSQSQDWIIPRLHAAAVFALPCVIEKDGGMDNLPTVIMEAMAASLPCVSTRLAGVPEMVIEGETGLLVESGDVEGTARAIEELLGDEVKRASYGSKGRVRARALFAKEVTARQLRREMVGGGLTKFDAGWIFDDVCLAYPMARNVMRRVGAMVGVGKH